MQIRFATPEEVQSWDNLVINNPDGGNIFQSASFATIKQQQKYKWSPKYIIVGELSILALERKIPLLGNIWYIPKGPGISNISNLYEVIDSIKEFARVNNIFLVKLEPELLKLDVDISEIKKNGMDISRGIQAASTIIININRPIDEVMASFSSKTRYNIRSAAKSELTSEITVINDESCKKFYEMMAETINGRSPIRNYDYYKLFWETHSKAQTGLFIFAKKGDQIISMDFINILGQKATRKDAASTRDHSIHRASAWLELEAIKYLQSKNVKEYDLYGSPPSDRIKDPTHPFYGFGNFKAGFNEKVTDYIGCIDTPINKLRYTIWKKYGERIIQKFYRLFYSESFY